MVFRTGAWSPGVWLACALVAILSVNGAAEESEFDKWLRGAPFDESKLLNEVKEPDHGALTPAQAIATFEISQLALILPLDAPGYLSEVANAFLEGFIQAAETDGTNFSLEIYRTDGETQSGLVAYEQAVANGAGMIIGPLLRSSVERVARLPGRDTVPTLLLQEPSAATHAGQLGTPLLYTFPLGGEPEVVQFANETGVLVPAQPAFVVVENSPLGERLVQTFEHAWRLTGNQPAMIRTVHDNDTWVAIHEELREALTVKKEEAQFADYPRLSERPAGPPAIFAAGGPEFASQARANVPSALAVYVLAAFHEDLEHGARNLLGLDGIRLFEMPYVLNLQRGDRDQIAASYATSLSINLQRYVAAGIDAYNIARDFPIWGGLKLWNMDGVTGNVVLDDGRFLRGGVLLEFAEGVLVRVHPEPVVDPEICQGDEELCE